MSDSIRDSIHFFARLFSYLDNHPELVEKILKDEKVDDLAKDNSTEKIEIPDIYQIHEKYGIEGLKEKLEECNLETLKEIVKSYRLDPKKYFYRWTTKKKFISFITDKVESKLEKGKSFITNSEENKAQQ